MFLEAIIECFQMICYVDFQIGGFSVSNGVSYLEYPWVLGQAISIKQIFVNVKMNENKIFIGPFASDLLKLLEMNKKQAPFNQ